MRYRLAFLFFLVIIWKPCAAQVSDTLFLYFENAAYQLEAGHKKQLDSLAAEIQKNRAAEVKIYGFTDQTGKLSENKDLSQKRSESVRHYLFEKKHKLNAAVLKEIRGMGPDTATTGQEKNSAQAQRQRRAEIIVSRPAVSSDFSNLTAGNTIKIENLNFIPGRHLITQESKPALDNLLLAMQQNPTLKIEIQGHICCQTGGKDGYDEVTKKYELSSNRARFVYNYLLQNGIEKNRLSYRGFGRTRPLVKSEKTEEDRQKNRRVEIQILSR